MKILRAPGAVQHISIGFFGAVVILMLGDTACVRDTWNQDQFIEQMYTNEYAMCGLECALMGVGKVTLAGLEPATFGSEDQRLIY